jgi:hypothetical protein
MNAPTFLRLCQAIHVPAEGTMAEVRGQSHLTLPIQNFSIPQRILQKEILGVCKSPKRLQTYQTTQDATPDMI